MILALTVTGQITDVDFPNGTRNTTIVSKIGSV